MNKKFIRVLGLGVGLFLAVMQTVTVKGQVMDPTGVPVIGASVLEKGTSNGVITDIDGNFS